MPRANNGPRLKRNSFGIWEIRWPENGRTRRRSTGTQDHGFAQKVLANFILLDERERVLPGEGGPLLVCEALGDPDAPGSDYWHEHVVPNVVDKTAARYARDKLVKHFGPIAVKDISPRDVDTYVNKRRAGELGRPSVNHTISRELSVLNAAINHAVKARRLARGDQPFIRLPGTSQPRDRWLTEDQANALLAAALEPQNRQLDKTKLPRVYLFVALALATASRKCALLEMTWEQIDFAGDMIHLNPRGRAQTKKRRPRVPISDELRPVLERAWREAGGVGNPDGTRRKRVLAPFDGVRTVFANAVRRAKLPRWVTPHVLRHTWATWAAQSGMDLWKIAGVLGDSLTTVTRTYAHHHPDHLRDAVNNVRPSRRPKLRIVA